MKIHLLIIAILSLVSVSGFASFKDLAVCRWNSVDSDNNLLRIHEDVGGQLVALYTTESVGGSRPTIPYKVAMTAEDGAGGPGLTFVGKGLRLHIESDGPGTETGFVSYLSIPKMNVKNARIYCKVDWE